MSTGLLSLDLIRDDVDRSVRQPSEREWVPLEGTTIISTPVPTPSHRADALQTELPIWF